MNVGDSILCKTDFVFRDMNLFYEGEYYLIRSIFYVDDYKEHFGSFWVMASYVPSYWVEVCGYNGLVRQFSLIRVCDFNYFYDYFKSVSELRRDKLVKISGSRL